MADVERVLLLLLRRLLLRLLLSLQQLRMALLEGCHQVMRHLWDNETATQRVGQNEHVVVEDHMFAYMSTAANNSATHQRPLFVGMGSSDERVGEVPPCCQGHVCSILATATDHSCNAVGTLLLLLLLRVACESRETERGTTQRGCGSAGVGGMCPHVSSCDRAAAG